MPTVSETIASPTVAVFCGETSATFDDAAAHLHHRGPRHRRARASRALASVMTKVPAFDSMDLNAEGKIVGLF